MGEHVSLDGYPSDIAKNRAAQYLKNTDWTFYNLLPISLNVYYLTFMERRNIKPQLLFSIKPHETKSIHADVLREGDHIYALRSISHVAYGEQNLFKTILPSYTLVASRKDIRLGDIVYDYADGGSMYSNSSADISGLFLHNCLSIPIYAYYKGNLVARIDTDENTATYNGGSPAFTYFENGGYGLKIGDEIGFSFTNEKKLWSKILLDDKFIKTIHIGIIDAGNTAKQTDSYGYSVTHDSVSGIPYYPSNPYAYQIKVSDNYYD
jgi:hypothetical protein